MMSNLLDAWDATMGTPTWTANTPSSWALTDLNTKYSRAQLESMLGDPVFDGSGNVVHAKAVKVRAEGESKRALSAPIYRSNQTPFWRARPPSPPSPYLPPGTAHRPPPSALCPACSTTYTFDPLPTITFASSHTSSATTKSS